ncbi:sigma-70 family RNA polymerase sigma factor [Colwellia sp. BRX9-1]|uniref:sigma-70 family RNA polymerase sigma factor n=1 Tax=Colwellia sp. BRX9-1 TaxID=2759830 RepID=UPI0015F73EE6|nr:sigma-70 family RNA polymerase sigma factor [Colwellia sp. BRX9-1]MBA6352712.1 sigma-70 family RNA polymerase sigma factor [Colwellia sp. BRX9-1]
MDIKFLSDVPVTELLTQWKNGDETAYDELFIQCYQQFRHQIRKTKIQNLNNQQTDVNQVSVCIDSTTDIINHLYPRLGKVTSAKLDNRADFYRLIGKVVYSIMKDQYRSKNAQKNTLPQEEKQPEYDCNIAEIMCDLERAYDALVQEKPRAAEIFQLSIFAGLNTKKIADIYDISLRTVQNELKFALAWYQSHFKGI